MSFQNQVAFVTGGASGIGRAVCLALAKEGARVAVVDIHAQNAERVAAEVTEAGGQGLAVQVDVTNYGSVTAGVEQTLARWERIDLLVAGAGWDRVQPFLETTPEFWDRVIGINYRGVLAACHAVLPHMIRLGGGAVVTIASEAGRAGSSGEAVYSGTKGAVIAFTKAVAREVSRKGIRVNCVAPGLVETPLLQGMIDEGHGKLMEAIAKATPIQRFGRPEEIAEAVLFMASPKASFITGQTLSVGGGLTMI